MSEVEGALQPSHPTPTDEILRFGSFEVDVRAGELRRAGLKIKLQGQPFDVLVALLGKPGQMVTREELHDKLWSQDTFVDFEHGLNRAINKVREALGDDADNPRFIETLPRRGYRFLVPVTVPAPDRTSKPDQAAAQKLPQPSREVKPATVPAAGITAPQDPLVGRTLGHYRIAEKIGSGGMGNVYRAHDQHLDREVAIKVLSPGTLADEHARKRFRREALALSKLNHPNIATAHDFDTEEGLDFLVLEYIPGVTLSVKLAARAMTETEVIALGAQLAEGLSAAHERGVVHGDLKPTNLLVVADERIKILDFGLARLRGPVRPDTPTESFTEAHPWAGTLAYMAPEQLLGGEIDARTDIYSAGCVLYEMATGQQPFADVDRSQLIGAILRGWQPSYFKAGLSPDLKRIIGKCLEKAPENRYQSAKELYIDLQRQKSSIGAVTSTRTAAAGLGSRASFPRSISLGRIVAASVFALVLLGAAIYWATSPPPMPRIVASHVLTHTGYPKAWNVSPIVDRGSLYFPEVRQSGVVYQQVPAAGGEQSSILRPNVFFVDISRDGSKMLWAVQSDVANGKFDTWMQPLPAGAPRLIMKDARWAIWNAEGDGIFFARNNDMELYRANLDGTGVERLATVPGYMNSPHLSPDGSRIRFTGSFPDSPLWEVGANGSNPHPILSGYQDVFGGTWSSDGEHYFFTSWDGDQSSLWAVSETRHWWEANTSPPRQLTFGPMSIGSPGISKDGKQLYAVGTERRGELSVYDTRVGKFVPSLGGESICMVDFSRDGQWIAYVTYPEGTLWRSRIDGSERRQLTVPPMAVINPRWSPDGKLIAFWDASNGDRRKMAYLGPGRIYAVSADGGAPVLLLAGYFGDPTWSPDGRSIAYQYFQYPASEVRILDVQSKKSSTVPGSKGMWSPRWSPDGKFLIALSGPSLNSRLMLFSFAKNAWAELASSGDFGWPCWSHDSKFVYALDGASAVRIAIADHKKDQIASLRGFRGTTYYFDRVDFLWLGFTPDGRPLTTRDTGIQELYAFDLDYK